jgi:hypothetical protein
MRIGLLGVAVAFTVGLSTGPAGAACNVRGEFCDYPDWASNAFAGRDGVPLSALPSYGSTRPSYETMPPSSAATVYGSRVYRAPDERVRRRYMRRRSGN